MAGNKRSGNLPINTNGGEDVINTQLGRIASELKQRVKFTITEVELVVSANWIRFSHL